MPKGSAELTNSRKNEIIDACRKLYETKSFKEITIKEIGNATSFTRTSVYNYFQTKEEIFLALLEQEYERWNEEIAKALDSKKSMTRIEFAEILAYSLSHRELMLKLLAMNLYDIEENSRTKKLVELKKTYKKSLDLIAEGANRCIPGLTKEEGVKFMYAFFPFVYGIYPYTSSTEKQKSAMTEAGIEIHELSIYEITLEAAKKLLQITE